MSTPKRASVYVNDNRVDLEYIRNGALIPDGNSAWRIEPVKGSTVPLWTARDSDGQYAIDEGDRHHRRRRTWTSLDAAIRFVIGDPQ